MELRWEAANESGFDHYAIERLTNGTEWAPIGRVNGGASTLRFTDLAPAAGANHYRLRMVDLDGSFAYSAVESVRILPDLSVYPTVTDGDVYLGGGDFTELRLVDAYGRVRQVRAAENGRVSLRGMAPGWYVIQARTRDASWVNGRVLLR